MSSASRKHKTDAPRLGTTSAGRGPYDRIDPASADDTTAEKRLRRRPGDTEEAPPPTPEAGFRPTAPGRIHRVDDHDPTDTVDSIPHDAGMVRERDIGGPRTGIPVRHPPERATKETAPHALTTKRRNTLPTLNFLLVAGLGLALILSVAGIGGPGIVPTGAAFMSLTIAVAVVATVTFVLMNSLRPSDRLQNRLQGQEQRIDTLERNIIAVAEARRRDIEAALLAHGRPVRRRHTRPEASHITLIEGIGPVYADRLARHGIRTVDDLKRRPTEQVADAAGVLETRADEWQSMARLMQVPAVGPQYAEMLVRAGIRTREQLGHQEPARLAARLHHVERAHHGPATEPTITVETARRWVEAARRDAMIMPT